MRTFDEESGGVSVVDPPRPPTLLPDAGAIRDARRRQRRRQGRIAVLALLAVLGGIAYLQGGGSGGAGGAPRTAGDAWARASVGHGISVSFPHGWHLFAPPTTALAYPLDRLLLTSYPASTGGSCSPRRAESALPATGALIYLFEYGATAGTVFSPPQGMTFPPQPAAFALQASEQGNYDCWTVPTYLVRFRAAGRLFQMQVALGAHVSPARRAQVLRILDGLRVHALAPRLR